MQVRQVSYKMEQMEVFAPNDFYKRYYQELIIDFETVFNDFMLIELPEGLSEAQLENVSDQKTNLLKSFVSGHLNFYDPTSKVFKRMNEEMGDTTKSGLILPSSKIIV